MASTATATSPSASSIEPDSTFAAARRLIPGTPPWEITFYGTEASLYIDREHFDVRSNEEGAEPLEVELSQQRLDGRHIEDFLDCIRTRKQPNCTAHMGHRSAQTSLLATRAYVSGRAVRFDPVKEGIPER